eukprot:TRINITY_DN8623_c0_g1_i5.p2 TRINITY_DN8623_c0_g1~~TRINITY_DN8623_c0_g1_i5.p2  ORF type:complete len:110 (-),score=32.20 TRINITY_DN8623_c0_g1_i5:484-813(-)
MSEVEECLQKLKVANKGVQQVIIVNNSGVPIRWLPATMDYQDVVQIASQFTELSALGSKIINELDPMNDWTFLRVRSNMHEIMVCPEKEFMMIVLQDPNIDQRSIEEKA